MLPVEQGRVAPHFEVHRVKGRILLSNGTVVALQGVREIFELSEPTYVETRDKAGDTRSKIVFIGRGIEAGLWQKSLDSSMASSSRQI